MVEPLPGSPLPRTNWMRRGLGVALCFGPVFLLLGSIGYWIVHRGTGFIALGGACGGLLLGLLNSYLTFIRPWRHHRRHGSMDGYRHVSGFPLVGTLMVTWAGAWGFGELPTAVVGLAASVLDTGGLPWFLVMTWRDRSMWDD